MRKADYTALAGVIARQLRVIEGMRAQAAERGQSTLWEAGALNAAQTIAREFANRASVDRIPFLKACGLLE